MERQGQRRVRKRLRCAGWSYRSEGAYFVTILTSKRTRFLSSIRSGVVVLTKAGEIVEECWLRIPRIHYGVRIDRFVIMPDHLHGIIWLDHPVSSLDQILGAFKSATTRQVNVWCETPGRSIWHRGYHDRIIRDQRHLQATRQYIERNPARWIE